MVLLKWGEINVGLNVDHPASTSRGTIAARLITNHADWPGIEAPAKHRPKHGGDPPIAMGPAFA